jgi:hypothetical protein
MKKKIIIFINTLLLNVTYSASIKFIGPCYQEPLFESEVQIETNQNLSLGQLTVNVLTQNKISFIGNEQGLNSIFNTPTGQGAIEIINQDEFNAYGWCYAINEIAPEVYPNEVMISHNDKITWWFGYASFKSGEWKTQCSPSYLKKPDQFCHK